MKTIKDAVIETNGKWQSGVGRFLKTKGPANINRGRGSDFDFGCNSDNTDEYWIYLCSREEFEACAKRLGYINGYRWGKEYCANGETPDLPDDVVYQVRGGYEYFQGWQERKSIKKTLWGKTTYFRIIDERYRPTEEKEKSPLGQYE